MKTQTVSTPPKTRSRGVHAARARVAFFFLLPALLAIALTAGYPLFKTFQYSFTDALITDPSSAKPIGLGNFWYTNEKGVELGLLQDPKWWGAVRSTFTFTFLSVGLEFVLGMVIALVLNSEFKGRSFLRTALLVPWAIPTVVSAQMWSFMYNDSFGLLGTHLGAVLADADKTLWAIIAVDVWKTTPFMALMLIAGLSIIPADLYEAADVDGASKWTQFWRITLPLLRPAILVAVVFRALDALRVFDVMNVMLGPNRASELSMTAYARLHMIDNQLLGYGSAVAVMIFLIILAFTVLYVASLRVRFD
ncbi:carbohydrate ABC transporter permease [Deinococcus roseus]|uniref:ABC transporter permease n=1 Tax=Deinococcus roseus TaxID=392414 RepID=A0ABQ2DDZ2_9DEIO|nr:sugar ABC transporter permease [Deinococcus roseus]GGJ54411.1 ABC transporter permease [Deinococcus roseus]